MKRLSGFFSAATADSLVDRLKHLVDNESGQIVNKQSANVINSVFLSPMSIFMPLSSVQDLPPSSHQDCVPEVVTEHSIFMKLSALNPFKAQGPDGIPAWLLKENADILASPVADILNCSYQERRLPSLWKKADITPLPKLSPITDINKHLRPISLTPILSKLAEDYVVEGYVKPAVMKKIDPNQYGTVSNYSTVHALLSMLHARLVPRY